MLKKATQVVRAILAISSMLSTSVLAYLPPIDFDGVEYVPLTLVHHQSGGQYAGWELVDGTAQVSVSGDGCNGGKALEIPASATDPAHLRREIPWSPTEEIAFIDFRTKPSTNPVGSEAGFYANGAQFAFQKSPDGLTGEVWVCDGNDGSLDPANDPEEWLQTSVKKPPPQHQQRPNHGSLFEQLNEMEIVFPGSELVLRYSLLGDPAPANP